MTKIKIIGGRYGYISRSGVYSVKTAESPPFEVEDSEAERLVKRGVAEIVGEHGKCPENEPKGGAEGSNPTGEKKPVESDLSVVPVYDEKTSAKELREIGKKCGFSFPVGFTKADMIAALDEYFELEDEDADSGIDLGVEPPVV